MLEKNYQFEPLRQKLGRLKRDCNDMGQLMAVLVKYADSDSTKDPASDEEKTGKGKKNGNGKGQQHNPANQRGNKHKADGVGVQKGGVNFLYPMTVHEQSEPRAPPHQ